MNRKRDYSPHDYTLELRARHRARVALRACLMLTAAAIGALALGIAAGHLLVFFAHH